MVFGDKPLARDVPASVGNRSAPLRALGWMLLAALAVYGVVALGG